MPARHGNQHWQPTRRPVVCRVLSARVSTAQREREAHGGDGCATVCLLSPCLYIRNARRSSTISPAVAVAAAAGTSPHLTAPHPTRREPRSIWSARPPARSSVRRAPHNSFTVRQPVRRRPPPPPPPPSQTNPLFSDASRPCVRQPAPFPCRPAGARRRSRPRPADASVPVLLD